jgi:hypothetical protein
VAFFSHVHSSCCHLFSWLESILWHLTVDASPISDFVSSR